MQNGVGGVTQSEEYVVLLRANEELTKRIEQLQAEKVGVFSNETLIVTNMRILREILTILK